MSSRIQGTKEFGPHLILDCRKINREKSGSIEVVSQFLSKLPELLGMTKIIPPYVFYYQGLVPEDEGITGMVIIAESHISFHSFTQKDYFFFDCFSCKPFDIDLVKNYVIETFDVKEVEEQCFARGKHFSKISVLLNKEGFFMDFLDYSQGFFGPQYTPCPQASSSVVVLPFGLELAVSWETGTSQAPEAILRASHEVECFDESFGVAPLDDVHVRTLAAFPIPSNMEEALSLLSQKVANILDNKLGFPIILGGEHTLTAGTIRPFVERYDHLVLLHVDAHADLRDNYFGDPWSHACAIRRCLDYPSVSLISFGIRNMDRHEFSFWKENPERVRLHLASEHAQVKLDEVREFLLGKNVYITIDVDGFDSSLMPATGTPEPGGLFWQDVIPLIRLAAEVGNVVGMDVVELAPRPSLHGCNFLCAKLLFKTISFLKHYNKI